MADHFQPLRGAVSSYLPDKQIKEIHRAYLFGNEAHLNQKRKSGEPFIKHPIEVGCILGQMHMDYKTIVAAILHDTIEDTDTGREDIRSHFGKEVEQLVEGVTKLEQIPAQNYATSQAANLRKMVLAMTDDIRVIIIKLGDRLHNMKTLDALAPAKRQRIARETLDIYAPIALRLGMNKIRLELEDLAFNHAHPWRCKVLTHHLEQARKHGKSKIRRIRTALQRRLKEEKITAEIIGREKHLYGVYAKMKRKNIKLRDIADLYAFRIITNNIHECYLSLGAIHSVYKPLPGRFKDYIAIPKNNGYQSLHTVLFGPQGLPIEVQIRSREMETVAESGIAAHWKYKHDEHSTFYNYNQKLLREWMRNIVELQEESGGAEEFVENLKIDLFPDDVFVFTPDGDIMKLPRGSTVLDLAYTIHTDIGNRCSGAYIENRRTSMREVLRSGCTVEILTSVLTHPSPEWLNIAVTAKARSSIRHYLKSLRIGKARQLGKNLLQRELESIGQTLSALGDDTVNEAIKRYGQEDLDQLYETIGLGNVPATVVARTMAPGRDGSSRTTTTPTPLIIKDSSGMVVAFPKCCYPLPGDTIVGELSPGRGLLIHRTKCRNLSSGKSPGNRIAVQWEDKIDSIFNTSLRIEVTNQMGVLALVVTSVSAQEINIVNVHIGDSTELHTTITFELEVKSVAHLNKVVQSLEQIPHVHDIKRV